MRQGGGAWSWLGAADLERPGVLADDDVVWLEVSVHDALGVQEGQPLHHLPREAQHLTQRTSNGPSVSRMSTIIDGWEAACLLLTAR